MECETAAIPKPPDIPESPIQCMHRMGSELDIELWVKRDDLLPFPLAGNKYRKLLYELSRHPDAGSIITTGGPSSNHCRTAAILAAERGLRCELVIHRDRQHAIPTQTMRIVEQLGAHVHVVATSEIRSALNNLAEQAQARGEAVHVIPGGCHTRAGVQAYADAYKSVTSLGFDAVVVASGTGATHAGLAIGAHHSDHKTQVVGISIARTAERAIGPITEAMGWITNETIPIELDDRFTFGGYERRSEELMSIISWAWQQGLPVDPTYTGKALFGLRWLCSEQKIPPHSRVLFWHTGGLMNSIEGYSNYREPETA